jgi:hypothetical protein
MKAEVEMEEERPLFEKLHIRLEASQLYTDDSVSDGFDPPNAQLSVRFRPSRLIDFTVSGSHVHAILPRRWIEDWVAEERARLGFIIEREDPVGTRRTSARLTTNVHPHESLTTYLVLRYDRRHEDDANGYHGQLGLNFDLFDVLTGSAYGAYSHHFLTRNVTGGIDLGTVPLGGFMVNAGAGYLHGIPIPEGDAIWDFHATAAYDFGAATEVLRGFRALALYQGFLQPDVLVHAFFFRLGWIFRG